MRPGFPRGAHPTVRHTILLLLIVLAATGLAVSRAVAPPVPSAAGAMGRGAVIPLDTTVNEEVWILANNHPVARGEIQISEDKICIAVTRAADVYDFMAGG